MLHRNRAAQGLLTSILLVAGLAACNGAADGDGHTMANGGASTTPGSGGAPHGSGVGPAQISRA
jgi:hypothetical protein